MFAGVVGMDLLWLARGPPSEVRAAVRLWRVYGMTAGLAVAPRRYV